MNTSSNRQEYLLHRISCYCWTLCRNDLILKYQCRNRKKRMAACRFIAGVSKSNVFSLPHVPVKRKLFLSILYFFLSQTIVLLRSSFQTQRPIFISYFASLEHFSLKLARKSVVLQKYQIMSYIQSHILNSQDVNVFRTYYVIPVKYLLISYDGFISLIFFSLGTKVYIIFRKNVYSFPL